MRMRYPRHLNIGPADRQPQRTSPRLYRHTIRPVCRLCPGVPVSQPKRPG